MTQVKQLAFASLEEFQAAMSGVTNQEELEARLTQIADAQEAAGEPAQEEKAELTLADFATAPPAVQSMVAKLMEVRDGLKAELTEEASVAGQCPCEDCEAERADDVKVAAAQSRQSIPVAGQYNLFDLTPGSVAQITDLESSDPDEWTNICVLEVSKQFATVDFMDYYEEGDKRYAHTVSIHISEMDTVIMRPIPELVENVEAVNDLASFIVKANEVKKGQTVPVSADDIALTIHKAIANGELIRYSLNK